MSDIDILILEKIYKKVGLDFHLLDFHCNKSRNELLIYNYILSHEFAKAFWGEKDMDIPYLFEEQGWETPDGRLQSAFTNVTVLSWQYHLQQLVLLPDNKKINYLRKFI